MTGPYSACLFFHSLRIFFQYIFFVTSWSWKSHIFYAQVSSALTYLASPLKIQESSPTLHFQAVWWQQPFPIQREHHLLANLCEFSPQKSRVSVFINHLSSPTIIIVLCKEFLQTLLARHREAGWPEMLRKWPWIVWGREHGESIMCIMSWHLHQADNTTSQKILGRLTRPFSCTRSDGDGQSSVPIGVFNLASTIR